VNISTTDPTSSAGSTVSPLWDDDLCENRREALSELVRIVIGPQVEEEPVGCCFSTSLWAAVTAPYPPAVIA
jgi:hypothetical protein